MVTIFNPLPVFTVIKMPTLHRLSCFRDDFIFFIYLYQVRTDFWFNFALVCCCVCSFRKEIQREVALIFKFPTSDKIWWNDMILQTLMCHHKLLTIWTVRHILQCALTQIDHINFYSPASVEMDLQSGLLSSQWIRTRRRGGDRDKERLSSSGKDKIWGRGGEDRLERYREGWEKMRALSWNSRRSIDYRVEVSSLHLHN